MKKQAILQATLLRVSIVALLISALFIAVWLTVSSMADESDTELMRVRTALSFKQTEINSLTHQIENSKGARIEYAKYILSRENDHFLYNVDEAKQVLSKLRADFQLGSELKLTLSKDSVLNEGSLGTLPYEITVRPNTKITFSGLTDTHLFAFVDALESEIPGILEVTELKITQKDGGLNTEALAKISTGTSLVLADGVLGFNWYSVQPKSAKVQ